MNQDIARAIRSACLEAKIADTPFSLAVISLDDLGAFRRQYGYELGDQVLSHVENVAREVLDTPDLYQTEEDCFLAALPEPVESLRILLERLRSRIASSKLRFTVDGESVAHSMTISAGVAGRGQSPISPEVLLSRSTEAWSLSRAQQNAVTIYASQDPLTQLPSGLSVLTQLETALEKATVQGRPLSVVQVDIDGFQSANNTFGVEACDVLLRMLADSLIEQFGPDAIVGRMWADEFLIILDQTRSEDAAFSAEAARRSIAALATDAGTLSLSIGVATYPAHAGDTGDLLRKVREARYRAQEDGGGRTRVAETDQMVTKTSHFSKIQLRRLAVLGKSQDRSEAALLREGLDAVLAFYEDSATEPSFRKP